MEDLNNSASSTQVMETPPAMGKVMASIELINSGDEELCRRGYLAENKIRRVKLEALVDTGCTTCCIPESDILKLGLPVLREVTTRYANGQLVQRKLYGPVNLMCMGRKDSISVLPGSTGVPALLGQIPLETLDLHVDPKNQRLIVNPESPEMSLLYVY